MTRVEASAENLIESKLVVIRVRRSSGIGGGANYYHHADVLVKNEEEALLAAKEGRIKNWRQIDRFDKTDASYEEFESFGEIDDSQARLVMKPRTYEEQAELEKKWSRSEKINSKKSQSK